MPETNNDASRTRRQRALDLLEHLATTWGTGLSIAVAVGVGFASFAFINKAVAAQADPQLKAILQLLTALTASSLTIILLTRVGLMAVPTRGWVNEQFDRKTDELASESEARKEAVVARIDSLHTDLRSEITSTLDLARVGFGHPTLANSLGSVAAAYKELSEAGSQDSFFLDIANLTLQEWATTMADLADGQLLVDREAQMTLDQRWRPVLQSASAGETIMATSYVDPEWWINNREWQLTNREAVNRGLIIARLFVFESDDERLRAEPIMIEQDKMGILIGWSMADDIQRYRREQGLSARAPRDLILQGSSISDIFSPMYRQKRVVSTRVIGEQKLTGGRKLWSQVLISRRTQDITDAMRDLNSYLAVSHRLLADNWASEFFRDDYATLFNRTDKEASTMAAGVLARLKELGLGSAPQMLDLACGDGRITIELQKLGAAAHLTGIDASDSARTMAETLSTGLPNIHWSPADMRDIPYATHFDALVCVDSFGYFNQSDNIRVLDSMSHVVKPGAFVIIQTYNQRYWQRTLRSEVSIPIGPTSGDCVIRSDSYEPDTKSLHTQFAIRYGGGAKFKPMMSTLLYSRDDLQKELSARGFVEFRVWSNLSGDPFQADTSRYLVIGAVKRSE